MTGTAVVRNPPSQDLSRGRRFVTLVAQSEAAECWNTRPLKDSVPTNGKACRTDHTASTRRTTRVQFYLTIKTKAIGIPLTAAHRPSARQETGRRR